MVFMGMAPIGALLAGALSHRLGAPLAVSIGGVICVCAAGIFGMQLPSFRQGARDLILAQEAQTGAGARLEISDEAAATESSQAPMG